MLSRCGGRRSMALVLVLTVGARAPRRASSGSRLRDALAANETRGLQPLVEASSPRAPAGDRRRLGPLGFDYVEVATLTAPDAAADDRFGYFVAIDGGTVVVGTQREAAYVLRTSDGGASYGHVYNLTDATGSERKNFGVFVAIDGSTVVIGAPLDDVVGVGTTLGHGSVCVYHTSDGGATYGKVTKLTASDAETRDQAGFGVSLAIDGDTVVVGAIGLREGGAVYVYHTTDDWGTHTEIKLMSGDAENWQSFGYSVAIDGATIVVGAYRPTGHGSSGRGLAYVLSTTDGGATYVQMAKLTASDAAADDYFGISVAIDGATVVIGATGAGTGGAVYVYRTTDGWGTHTETKLMAADAAAGDEFGGSVAIDGGTIVVGASGKDNSTGKSYVFRTTDGGASYGQVAELRAADAAAEDNFGKSVAISGRAIVVGGESGSAYVFGANDPTSVPTSAPTDQPSTSGPTVRPSYEPTTARPTSGPTTALPSYQPTPTPTTKKPTSGPTGEPTLTPSTTPNPTASSTAAPQIIAAVTFTGISESDAISASSIFAAAIASVVGVDVSAIEIIAITAATSRRRRLDDGGVVVEFLISAADAAEAASVIASLDGAAADPAIFDSAVVGAAAASDDDGVAALVADIAARAVSTRLRTQPPTNSPTGSLLPTNPPKLALKSRFIAKNVSAAVCPAPGSRCASRSCAECGS